MEVSGQLDTPTVLPPGKEPRYPLDGSSGGPQNQSGRCKEKNLDPSGIRIRAVQPIAIPSELYISVIQILILLFHLGIQNVFFFWL
jgi:hypothetical protein